MSIKNQGFTLIELIVVIVILGILAATALPKFIDLSTEAYDAAAEGYAGALNSASSINYGGCKAKGNVASAGKCVPLATTDTCSSLGALVLPAISFTVGALPDPTVAKTLYIVTDSNLTTTGTTCNFVYGNGKTGGVAKSFVGLATG